MGFDTIIRNGTVVTATDSYASDIGIEGGRITSIAQALPIENARKVIEAAGRLVMPGGSTCTLTSTCRLAVRQARTTSNPERLPPHSVAPRP